jgi:hypothetical protein
LLIFPLPVSLKFTCNIALNIFYIFTKQSSEKDLLSSSYLYSNLVSRLEGVNRAKLKFTNINTTTSRVSIRNKNESAREDAKQISSK